MWSKMEKLSAYATVFALIFMGWQSWRETDREISNVKERTAKLEVKYELGERVKALEIVTECEIRWRNES